MNGREQGGAIQGEGKGGAVVEGEQGVGQTLLHHNFSSAAGEGGDSLVFSLYKTTSRCLKAIDKLWTIVMCYQQRLWSLED